MDDVVSHVYNVTLPTGRIARVFDAFDARVESGALIIIGPDQGVLVAFSPAGWMAVCDSNAKVKVEDGE